MPSTLSKEGKRDADDGIKNKLWNWLEEKVILTLRSRKNEENGKFVLKVFFYRNVDILGKANWPTKK